MLPFSPQVLLLFPSLTQPQPPWPPLWFPYEHPSLLLQGFCRAVTLTRMLFFRHMPGSLPHFPWGLVKCHTSAKPSLAKLHKKNNKLYPTLWQHSPFLLPYLISLHYNASLSDTLSSYLLICPLS